MVAQQLDHYEGSPHVLKQWDTGYVSDALNHRGNGVDEVEW